MAWLELHLQLNGTPPAPLETALQDAGALAITLRDAGDQPLLEPGVGETPLWQDVTLTALFPVDVAVRAIEQVVDATAGDALAARWQRLEDRVWEREWLKRFGPQRFGERLWVVPGDAPPPQPDAANVRLDPGLAFGTGDHPTTAMCLEWLGNNDVAGHRVIDYGCGSGILAIAALLLGAESVVAIDIDPQARLATRDNAERNGVAARIEIADAGEQDLLPCHTLLANILAGPLADLAPTLLAAVADGGTLTLSGILAEQADAVRAAYSPQVRWTTTERRGDWVMLSGVRVEGAG